MLEYTVIKICDHNFQYINNLKLIDSSLAAKLLIFSRDISAFWTLIRS